MIFCEACGARNDLRVIEMKERPVCPRCGQVKYQQLIVGAGALIEVSGRLLLIRRAHDPFAGCWCLPAGHVDFDEDPRNAATREALEETGLQVEAEDLGGVFFFSDHPRGCGIFVVYRCSVRGGELRATVESTTPTFFDRDQMPDDVAGGGHRQAIDAWREARV